MYSLWTSSNITGPTGGVGRSAFEMGTTAGLEQVFRGQYESGRSVNRVTCMYQ